MSLARGARLGPYEVIAKIGQGGMGEVYRAHDTKLGRSVALKILPDLFANDPERKARFQREAHVLASLNHPNIAQIYGVEDAHGLTALVMEFVEGPTLADRIAAGRMPLAEALPIARQITDALDTAHGQGIVHRDLKPSNIKVRDDGTVKVLDFGLAKIPDTVVASNHLADSPTITSPTLTERGHILGTAAYMSPEQARGRPVDKRADIWAFGCVLWEMLTGRRAFGGDSVSDTLAAIIRAEPDLSEVPREVRRVLESCLKKGVRERLRDIGDVWTLLEGEARPASRPAAAAWLPWTIAGVLASALVAFIAADRSREPAASDEVIRFAIRPPAGWVLTGDSAVAPDGRRIVFGAQGRDGMSHLWLQSLDAVVPQLIRDSAGATSPFWSPDSSTIGFFTGATLRRIDLPSGRESVLADVAFMPAGFGASWSGDVVVFARSGNGPLLRVGATGGETTPATTLDDGAGEVSHRFPSFLPDGEHFVYVAMKAANQMTINVGSLRAPADRRVLGATGSAAHYAEGALLFARAGGSALVAQPFDPDRLEFTGDPQVIVESVQIGAASVAAGFTSVSLSPAGLLVYRDSRPRRQVAWFDRAGTALGALTDVGQWSRVELSHAGESAAVVTVENGNRDIWIYDTVRRLRTARITSDQASDDDGVWSPDDRVVVFDSNRNGAFDLYRRDVEGSSGAEQLLYSDNRTKFSMSFSPDGRHLLYFTVGDPKTHADIWVLPDPLGTPGPPSRILGTEFIENTPRFSPDGKWIAYSSTESGATEIWITAFPGPGGKQVVSRSGGIWPRWRRDGSELFFVTPQGELMVATVRETGGDLHVGTPRRLFGGFLTGFYSYDISPDGQRILAVVVPPDLEEVPITVVKGLSVPTR